MRKSERYLQDVLDSIHAPAAQKKRLREDLETHFEEALQDGAAEDEIIRRLGEPGEVARSFMSEIPLHFGGSWRRTGAFLFDLLVCLNLTAPFLLLVFFAFPPKGNSAAPLLVLLFFLVGLGATGVFLLYFPLFEFRFGQTPGKKLFHLWVIGESGQTLSIGQAIVRRLSMYFEFLWLDALFVPFTEKKQRALDIVARTVVIRDPRAGVSWLVPLLSFALILTLIALTVAALILARAS